MTISAVAISTIAVVAIAAGGAILYTGDAAPGPVAASPAPVVTPTDPIPQPASSTPKVTTDATVAVSDTIALVTGTVNPNGASVSYWYEYATTPNGAMTLTSVQMLGSAAFPIPASGSITKLLPDTVYYFRLVAENRYGRVLGAQYSFRTTRGTPAPVGGAPTARTLAASGISRTGAALNGQVNPHQAATHFWFEYGTTAGLGNATPLTAVGDGGASLPVSSVLADLAPATTYYFRLDAQNRFGTVNGPAMSFTTAGPAAAALPSIATDIAADIDTSAATLRGTVNPNGAPTSYWFEYSTDSLLGSALLNSTARISAGSGTNPISASTRISDLARRTTYYFRLVAENDAGVMRGARRSFKTK